MNSAIPFADKKKVIAENQNCRLVPLSVWGTAYIYA